MLSRDTAKRLFGRHNLKSISGCLKQGSKRKIREKKVPNSGEMVNRVLNAWFRVIVCVYGNPNDKENIDGSEKEQKDSPSKFHREMG